MKRYTSILMIGMLLIAAGHSAMAQENVTVNEQVKTMSLGDRTGYTIALTGMSEKDAVKTLRTWISDLQKKADVEESAKHEILVKGFAAKGFEENPTQIYFLFEESKEGITVTGFFEQGGTFISGTTAPDKVEKCRQLMTRFAHRIEKVKIEEALSAANKELEKRNDEQAALEKKQKQLNDDIADCEKTIQNAKSGLEENASEQKNKKEEIGKQDATVKELEKRLKQYEDY